MDKFPVEAPIEKVLKSLEMLGFTLVRQGNHIAVVRQNPDGTSTPLTLPNRRKIKGSTLRSIITQSSISREDFLKIYSNL